MAIAVVIPGQFGQSYARSQIYARRRLTALLSLAAIVLVLFVGAGHVVANRGGAPASASMIRPANPTAAPRSRSRRRSRFRNPSTSLGQQCAAPDVIPTTPR